MTHQKPSPSIVWNEIWRQLVRWLTPGLGVKRWFGLILLGATIISVGIADILLDLLRVNPNNFWSQVVYTLALLFLPAIWRAVIFGSLGIGLIGAGIWGLNRSLLAPFLQPGKPVVDTLARHRLKERGPRVVVIGGGHGLATLLRGLKKYSHNITAIVTVADDGGSSGRLRDSMGILPPGDIRNCLAALSNDEDLITQLFRYRFTDGGGPLEGHSFGNLFISALTELTGSFENAVAESGRALSVYGQVLPATLHDVRLVADKDLPHLQTQVRVHGESKIPEVQGHVRRLWLEPNSPPAFPAAIQAILQADLIVIGPGSLYTSILPNLLVPDISNALQVSQGLKIFVCNVTTQPGETDQYTCYDHVNAIENHIEGPIFDLIVANNNTQGNLPNDLDWVTAGEHLENHYNLYRSDVADSEIVGKHNAEKLAQTLIDLLMERTGPLAL